jgi:HTH-type transcriptional regulator, glycine betaine synthesis regulator
MPTSSNSSHSEPAQLADWEVTMIDIFIRAAGLFGQARSIGEIYGILYCRPQPLTFDEIVVALGISRGSVSQGLKTLRQLGAVKLQYQPGDRKDYYQPELSIERLVRGFISDQFRPQLEEGSLRLKQVEAQIEQVSDPAHRQHATARLKTLQSWQQRTRQLIPLVFAILGGAKFLQKETDDENVV